MNKNIPFYSIAIAVFILLKFWIGTFDNNTLIFLLKPISSIFEIVSGTQSEYDPVNGFYFEKFNVFIDKSCSGYNFMLLCFIMLYFKIIIYVSKISNKLLMLPVCLGLAYILAIISNSSRIILLVFIQEREINIMNFAPRVIHESIGVVTYLFFLISIYLIIEKILHKRNERLEKSPVAVSH